MRDCVLATAAGFLAGTAASMGLGGGSVLLIYLTVFAGINQLTAQGINLVFFLPVALLAVIFYLRKGIIDFKETLPVVLSAIPFSLIFGYIVKFINPGVLRKIFGGVILLFGIYQIFADKKVKQGR